MRAEAGIEGPDRFRSRARRPAPGSGAFMKTLCREAFGDPAGRRCSDIQAVILAGGLGTRLRSVVADKPKVLAPVNGRPFIEYLFEQLVRAGIRDAVLCTGYLGEKIREVFGDRWRDLNLAYSQEAEPLGTGGALRLAGPYITSDTVLVLNGDSYLDGDLAEAFDWHRDKKAGATILLAEVADTGRYGRVLTDPDGNILRFREKSAETGKGFINAGLYFIERKLLLTIGQERPLSLEKEIFPSWTGKGLCGKYIPGAFLDIGSAESYSIADNFFKALNGKR